MGTENVIRVYADGALLFLGRSYRCTLGKAGVVEDKREGDGATPVGKFPLRRVFYRSDRVDRPQTALQTREIAVDDGWCDDAAHADYNRLVKLPFDAGHEEMRREDGLYDVVVELGYNDDPPVPGRGSAVFLHVAHPDGKPTRGCVGLALSDLLEVLGACDADTKIRVFAEKQP